MTYGTDHFEDGLLRVLRHVLDDSPVQQAWNDNTRWRVDRADSVMRTQSCSMFWWGHGKDPRTVFDWRFIK